MIRPYETIKMIIGIKFSVFKGYVTIIMEESGLYITGESTNLMALKDYSKG